MKQLYDSIILASVTIVPIGSRIGVFVYGLDKILNQKWIAEY